MFFFFNATPTTEIYTLSLHDALPIYPGFDVDGSLPTRRVTGVRPGGPAAAAGLRDSMTLAGVDISRGDRSEEHTSELQSQFHLVCRLLLEKKKKQHKKT